MTIILTIALTIAALLAPAAWAQQPAAPAPAAAPSAPDPQVVMAQAISDLQDRVAGLEKDTATKKEVAALRAQLTVDRSRFASAVYRITGAEDPDSRGKEFGHKPQKQEGNLFAAADGLASRIRARDEATQPATPPAAAPAAPAPPAVAAPPPVPPSPAEPVRVAPPPATSDRDRRIADELERLAGGLAGLARVLRQP